MEGYHGPAGFDLLALLLLFTSVLSVLPALHFTVSAITRGKRRGLMIVYWAFTVTCVVLQLTHELYMGIVLYCIASPVWTILFIHQLARKNYRYEE